jgi:hypothetical protein
MAIAFLSVTMVSALLYAVWVRADAKSRERGDFAEQMTQDSDEMTVFYASGPLNNQLIIVPEYAEHGPSGQADCDAIVDLFSPGFFGH